jgi:2-keto-3-deoxy-6-phosphogluconate aldolase
MNKQVVINAIIKQGMLPLYYHADADVSIEVCKSLYRAGIRVMEYTNRGENALLNFQLLRKERDRSMPEMILGIGTIKSVADVENFEKMGADFFISPGTIPSVGERVHKENKLWIPGCMTTTEIMVAEQAGAKFVKLFPGNLLGPAFVSSIKDLFPNLLFMPTGGVDMSRENIESWFKAGVSAVGMGSKLISKIVLDNKEYAALERDTKLVLASIQSIKK